MKNQNKVIPFTFHNVSFNVAITGNADTDTQTGNVLTVVYLKVLESSHDEANPIPPKQPLLPYIVQTMASTADCADIMRGFLMGLDMFLQPTSHAAKEGLSHFELNDLLAEIANVTAE